MKKCKHCSEECCIYRNVIDGGEVCINELDDYIESRKNLFTFNNTGVPDILIHSIRRVVEPLAPLIMHRYMKPGDVLKIDTLFGQVAIGKDLDSSNKIGLRWRHAFNCLDNDGKTPDEDVYMLAADNLFLIKVPKGEARAYCLSIETLNKLPFDDD